MLRLKDKIIVVSAAGQGMGRSSVIAMAKEGATVWATDINKEALMALKEECDGLELTVKTAELNVLDKTAIKTFSEKVGPIDVLFNCAGFVASGSVLEASDDDFDFSVNINIKAMFHMIQAFLPAMLERKAGSIINMASIAGIKGIPNRMIYCTTKAAVIGLTKSIAADYVTTGVRCNAICPGTVRSPSLDERIAEQAKQAGLDVDEVRKDFNKRQPMGRLGTADEVAHLVVYLASDESTFVTGANHIIDGGWIM